MGFNALRRPALVLFASRNQISLGGRPNNDRLYQEERIRSIASSWRRLPDERDELLDGDLGGSDDAAERAAIDLGGEGYRDRGTSLTFEADMAAFLRKDPVAES